MNVLLKEQHLLWYSSLRGREKRTNLLPSFHWIPLSLGSRCCVAATLRRCASNSTFSAHVRLSNLNAIIPWLFATDSAYCRKFCERGAIATRDWHRVSQERFSDRSCRDRGKSYDFQRLITKILHDKRVTLRHLFLILSQFLFALSFYFPPRAQPSSAPQKVKKAAAIRGLSSYLMMEAGSKDAKFSKRVEEFTRSESSTLPSRDNTRK